MDEIDAAAARLASGQHGVLSLVQYRALGGNRKRALRRCEWGIWEQTHGAVFRIAGSPVTIHQRLMAEVLAAGPGAVVSHRAAAFLWDGPVRGGVPIEVSVGPNRQGATGGAIWHRSCDLELAAPESVDGIPTTGLARTLLDLGAVDRSLVRPFLWHARRVHGLEWADVIGVLMDHSRRGRTGLGALREVTDEHYGQIAGDSRTEDRAFQILVDSRRVPVPDRLVPVRCADGVTVTVDFMWPAYGVILEIYGAPHFFDERVQQLDAHRINQLELAGYSTLVYTGKMLRRPDHLVLDVAARLRQRGWPGSLLV